MEFWRRKKAGKGKCFLKNGSMFPEKLIADCNDISNPIRMFSSHQISKATNHFDPEYGVPGTPSPLSWYKGAIEGRSYLIKRFTEQVVGEEESAFNDIALSSRVSNHIGFLKLVGCCLDFPFPVMIFEDLEYRALNHLGSVSILETPLLPWNVRLKIAKDVAIAITYLHTALPRIIIHRDIKATNVLLDKNGMAKLTDFSVAVTLPEGKTWIKDRLAGTVGYIDPIYHLTEIVSEYTDVYSFGIFMLVLLLGRPQLLSDGNSVFTSILKHVKDLQERGEHVEFGGGSNDMRLGQMRMFLDLTLRCFEERNGNEDRPKVILVAKEIKLIERSLDC